MVIGMNITLYNATNQTDKPYNITLEVPMDNLYIQVSLLILNYTVQNRKLVS